jgi:hypothetical protein
MEMVEKARRAVQTAWAAQGEVPFPLYDREAEAIARAVMEAMRTPTDRMLMASGLYGKSTKGKWMAMIAEALSSGEEERGTRA